MRRFLASHRAGAAPPTPEAARLRAALLEAVLQVSRAKDARVGRDPRSTGGSVADVDAGPPRNPDLSVLDPIELDRFTPHDRLQVLYRFAAMPAVDALLEEIDPRPVEAPTPVAAPAPAASAKSMGDLMGLLGGGKFNKGLLG